MNKNCDGCLKAIDGICFPTGKDKIESWEIRTGHGWDKFTELEKSVFLLKSLMKGGEK